MMCRLCQKDRMLCDSHIVPEFIYRDCYNDDHVMMGINGLGNKGWKALQKGLREKLLCRDCEQFLNDKYEKPFLKEWGVIPFPRKMNAEEIITIKVGYPVVKLFILSVLFRESVSTLPTFAAVRLGPHEDRLRQMLLNENVGEEWCYPILAMILVKHSGEVVQGVITQPYVGRFDGHTFYRQAFAGVDWSILFSSHRNESFQRNSLRESGEFALIAHDWSRHPQIQAVHHILKQRPE